MTNRLAKICPLLPFALILLLASFPASAQEFVFPPELKWWICEIQKADKGVSLEKFKFSEERFIYEEDGFATYKNRLYPVFKKWNFYGDKFAYNDIFCGLQKEKGGKYSLLGEPEGAFAVFNRNETLLWIDFFGSAERLDSFCWVRDDRIVAVGRRIVGSHENDLSDVDFVIYDYAMKDGRVTVREYIYSAKGINTEKLRLRWTEQRDDYFE